MTKDLYGAFAKILIGTTARCQFWIDRRDIDSRQFRRVLDLGLGFWWISFYVPREQKEL